MCDKEKIILKILNCEPFYDDFYVPYSYPFNLTYDSSGITFSNTLKMVVDSATHVNDQEKKKAYTQIKTLNVKFKNSFVADIFCDLLSDDYHSKICTLKSICSEYSTIYNSPNMSLETLKEHITQLFYRFKEALQSLTPVLLSQAAKLFRDEILCLFHNKYNEELINTALNQQCLLTADYWESYMSALVDYITPVLAVDQIESPSLDFEFHVMLVEDKVRKFLIQKFSSVWFAEDIELASPLQEISDAIDFFRDCCQFLADYRHTLIDLDPDIKLGLCIKISEQMSDQERRHSVKKHYDSFQHRWNDLNATIIDEHIPWTATYFSKKHDTVSDYCNGVDDLLKSFVSEQTSLRQRTIRVKSFFDLVFIALLELIANGDALAETVSGRKQPVYIKKCENCGKYFLPKKANILYCDRIVPNSNKKCIDIGAKNKHMSGRSAVQGKYDTISKRIREKINYLKKDESLDRERYREMLENKAQQWNAKAQEHRRDHETGKITDTECIERFERDYNELFNN